MYVVIGGTNGYEIPYAYGIYHSFENAVEGAIELYKRSSSPSEEDIEAMKEYLAKDQGYDDIVEISRCEIKDWAVKALSFCEKRKEEKKCGWEFFDVYLPKFYPTALLTYSSIMSILIRLLSEAQGSSNTSTSS